MKVPSGTPNCSTCQVFAKMRRPGVSLNIWLALQRVVSGSQPTSCPAWVKCCGMITGVAAVPQLWVQKTCNSTTWGVCKKILEKTTNYNGKQIPRFITMFNGKKGACMEAPLRVPFRHGQHERNRIKMSPQISTIYSVAGLCHGWLAGWITSFQWQACSWCSFCGAMFQIFKATWQQLKCQVQKCISGWVMSYEKSFWLRKTEPDEQNVADDWHDPDMDYFTRDSSSVVPTPSHHLQASHGECHAAPWHHRCESAFTSVYGSCMHACIRNIICIIYTCVHAVCINMCMHVHPTHTIYIVVNIYWPLHGLRIWVLPWLLPWLHWQKGSMVRSLIGSALGNTILSITVFFPVRDRCQLVEKF